jgi:hypothetical protein
MITKTSFKFAIVLTAILAFSPLCDAQSLRERIKERVQTVKESIKSDWSLDNANTKPNQNNTDPGSQTQKTEVLKPKTINEFADITGLSQEEAIRLIKSIPDDVTIAIINDVEINVEDVREAASQVKETAPFQIIDLGLSVSWASCNIGAYSPAQYGTYLAWGTLLPPSEINHERFGVWQYYRWNDPNGEFTKYDESDNKTRLELIDDVAQNKYGGGWRVPTNDEFKELISECTWSWQEHNGVCGYEVTGPNGNSIFLPAGGYNPSSHIMSKGEYGAYWSAEIGSERRIGMTEAHIDYHRGCFLAFFPGGTINVTSGDRNVGNLVRAVWDDSLVLSNE